MMSGVNGAARRGTYGARALPLPPPERRQAVVTTAIEMLRRDKEMPSTRRLAQECGIAEGTLFRAFPTKADLLEAIASSIACPYPFRERLLALSDDTAPTPEGLRERLLEVARLLQRRFTDIFETLGPLGIIGPPRHGEHPGCPGPVAEPLSPHAFRESFARALAPYAPVLRVHPDDLIDAVRYLAFAGTHQGLSDGRFMTAETIVDLLLDGALLRPTDAVAPASSTDPKGTPC